MTLFPWRSMRSVVPARRRDAGRLREGERLREAERRLAPCSLRLAVARLREALFRRRDLRADLRFGVSADSMSVVSTSCIDIGQLLHSFSVRACASGLPNRILAGIQKKPAGSCRKG